VAALNCYLLTADDRPLADLVDTARPGLSSCGSTRLGSAVAEAWVLQSQPHSPPWVPFLEDGLGELHLPPATGPSAIVLLEVPVRGRRRKGRFAFAFGPSGRHLLRGDPYVRGFGLRTALNLLYPRDGAVGARLRAVDTKRRSSVTVRSRLQASQLAGFEVFGVDRLRDIVSKATGAPLDSETWGERVVGGDSLQFTADVRFADLPDLCRRIHEVYRMDDYRDHFDWIDYIQPVVDAALQAELQRQVVAALRGDDADHFELAPPEVVDWERVAAFQYPSDRTPGEGREGVTYADLRLGDYLAGLARSDRLGQLTTSRLKSSYIDVLDSDRSPTAQWPVWKCLVGELFLDGQQYILDEGEFFAVRSDYSEALDAAIDAIPTPSVELPGTRAGLVEAEYNRLAARANPSLLCLDGEEVRSRAWETPVEICDLLSDEGHLVHVKRRFGSSKLSHLFAQGVVSAALLQSSPEFRAEALSVVQAVAGERAGFALFDADNFAPVDFEVVYAIIGDWHGRRASQALPFFSKVNLREARTNLVNRGYHVALAPVQTD
jgi:uncharacterized protein (TIGR04141 family)